MLHAVLRAARRSTDLDAVCLVGHGCCRWRCNVNARDAQLCHDPTLFAHTPFQRSAHLRWHSQAAKASASPPLGIRYVDALHTQAMQSVKSISCLHRHSAAPYSIHQHQHHRRAQQQINLSILQGHVGHQLIDLLAPDAMAKLHPTSIDIHSLGCCLHEQALQFMPDSPPSLPAGPLVNRLRHPNHRGDA